MRMVLQFAKYLSIEIIVVMKQGLELVGHLLHWQYKRLPKQAIYVELVEGKCPELKLHRRNKDCFKYTLKKINIDVSLWEDFASEMSTR